MEKLFTIWSLNALLRVATKILLSKWQLNMYDQ